MTMVRYRILIIYRKVCQFPQKSGTDLVVERVIFLVSLNAAEVANRFKTLFDDLSQTFGSRAGRKSYSWRDRK